MNRILKVVLLCACLVGCIRDAMAQKPIKIGVCLPLTGAFAEYGEQAKQGILAAWEEKPVGILLHGGGEFQVERPIIVDTQSDPQRAVQVVQDLIENDDVVAIIGGLSDTEVEAMAPIVQQAQNAPMLCPWTMNPHVTENRTGNSREFNFRITNSNAVQGFVAAQYVHENLQKSTAAVMVDTTQSYSTGIADAFIRYFEAMGGQVLLKASYRTGDQDFTQQLAQIAQIKPDALYVPGLAPEVARIARQSKEFELDLPLIAHDAAHTQSLIEIGGNAVEGLTIITHFESGAKRSRFWQIFGGESGFLPTSVAALSWDAYQVIMHELEQMDEASDLQQRLEERQSSGRVVGVTGEIVLNRGYELSNVLLNQGYELSNPIGMVINLSTLLPLERDKFTELFEAATRKLEVSYSQLLWNELQPMLLQEREKALKLEILQKAATKLGFRILLVRVKESSDISSGTDPLAYLKHVLTSDPEKLEWTEKEKRNQFDTIEGKINKFMAMVVDNASSADAIGAELEHRRNELDEFLDDWAEGNPWIEEKPVSEEDRQRWNEIIQNAIVQVKTPNAEMQKSLDDFAQQLAQTGIEWQKSIQEVINADLMTAAFTASLESARMRAVLSLRVKDGKFVESEEVYLEKFFITDTKGRRSASIAWYELYP